MQTPPAEFIVTASDVAAVEAGYGWDPAAVDHVLRFAGTLRDPMNADKPYRLLAWQLHETRRLFGWRRPNGRRRFTRLNVWIPKKNGKTSWLAFLALVMLLVDKEKRPGCYVASATGELAEDIYTEAKALTVRTAWRRLLDVQNFRRRFRCEINGGEFRALAASAEGAEGLKGSFVVIDEIHATLKRKPKLYASLRYAGSGRKQPIAATISTAGDDRQSLPYEIYTRAKGIITGDVIDLHTLAIVYESADQDDYTDDDFRNANPAIGEVLEVDQIRDDWTEAKLSDRATEDFKRYRMNVWVKRSTAWLDVNKWIAGMAMGFDLSALAGLPCFVGVDLASKLDLTAAVAVWPLPGGRFFFLPRFWLPREGIRKRAVREMDYEAAARSGDLELCDGQAVDFDLVARWIEGLPGDVQQIGFDPWRAGLLAKDLEGAGFDCVEVRQGWAMSEPALEFERLIETGEAVHGPSSVMSWCIENVEVRRDTNGKIRPVKPIEQYKRIDGVVASIMGLYLALYAEQTAFVCG